MLFVTKNKNNNKHNNNNNNMLCYRRENRGPCDASEISICDEVYSDINTIQ